jgi:putative methionine-R-sulfoxide reductase with GAF domain
MDNDMENECETLKKQLAGFREIHRALMEIMADVPEGQQEELICSQFKKISGAKETALFLLNPKSERFEFRAAVGQGAAKYAGGFLDTDGGELQAPRELDLQAGHSQTITIRTKSKVYDFHDKFILVVPVTAFSAVYGILICDYDSPCTIDDSDTVELIRVFLNQLGPLFKCDVEIQRLEEKANSLELLYEIGSKLSSIRDEDQLLENILKLIERYIQVDRCSLMIMDKDRKHLSIKKAFGIHDVDIGKVKVPLGQGIAGYVALGTRPLLIKDIAAEKHLISQVPQKENFRTNSLLSVPLVSQGEVIGVINVNNRKDGQPLSEADMELLCKIGSEIAAVLQRSYMALQLKKARDLDRDIKRSMV